MADVEPRHVTPSALEPSIAARYDELEALAAARAPKLARTFRTRMVPLEGGESLSITELDDDFHSMRVALRLDAGGTVLEAAGRMNRNPYETCPRALEFLSRLTGVSLVRGAMAQARERVPRTEACLHLLDMLQVAFRSWTIAKGHDVPWHGEEGRRTLLQLLPHMRDTCVSYAIAREG